MSPANAGTQTGIAWDEGGWDVYGYDWRHYYDCMLAPVARQAAGARHSRRRRSWQCKKHYVLRVRMSLRQSSDCSHHSLPPTLQVSWTGWSASWCRQQARSRSSSARSAGCRCGDHGEDLASLQHYRAKACT